MNYINPHSWRCLLGKQSKNIIENNGLYQWSVGKRNHFCTNRDLTIEEVKNFGETNFHYLSKDNCELIKQYHKVSRAKNTATTIDLTQLSLIGNANKSLRYAVNKGLSYKLAVEDNFRYIEDVEVMINEWSNVLAVKYFRDNSGKNTYFFKNNFHKDCHSVFLYDKDVLVAFGAASPEVNGYSSYILGKALCNKYYGLSEYADLILYQKCMYNGIKIIDLGQTTGGMEFYKNKFSGSDSYEYYNGKVL